VNSTLDLVIFCTDVFLSVYTTPFWPAETIMSSSFYVFPSTLSKSFFVFLRLRLLPLPCPNSFVNEFRDKGHWSRDEVVNRAGTFSICKIADKNGRVADTHQKKRTLQWQNLLLYN